MYLCLVFFGYLSSEPSHRVVRKPRQPAERNGDTLPPGYPTLSGVQPQPICQQMAGTNLPAMQVSPFEMVFPISVSTKICTLAVVPPQMADPKLLQVFLKYHSLLLLENRLVYTK